MKLFLTLLLLAILNSAVQAQWSNTTNQFYDSLDMPVARAANDQRNPLVIKSEPDGGYFVIWEDSRNANGNGDIYAQKYDNAGHVLWALNGVPVATGDAPDQQYSNISNGVVNYYNYQNVSHAASDGNGGFYITWHTYLASPVSSYGVFIQHVRSDGSLVFASEGKGIAIPTVSSERYDQPQLIADGNGGFFIGYKTTNNTFYGSVSVVTVYCYKDVAGVLKFYGGGVMSDLVNYFGAGNNYRFCPASGNGGFTTIPISGPTLATTSSFKIFPDGQGGCAVVMVEQPTSEKCFPAFNQLCRVKQDSHVQTQQNGNLFFKRDSVVKLYSADVRNVQIDCTDASAPPGSTFVASLYTVFNQGVQNLLATRAGGVDVYDPIFIGSGKFNDAYTNYAIEKINGTVLPTQGNINALLVTWNQRNYVNSQLTNWGTRGIVLAMEKYDSIPYQLCSGAAPRGLSYNGVRPAGMNRINEGKSDMDTLIAPFGASYFYDYSLTGSGNRAFVVTSVDGLSGAGGPSPFYYQEAKIFQEGADSFALKLNTPPNRDTGLVIGIGTGYDRFPFVAGDGAGNATFYYVGPSGRDFVKASPVEEGGKLRWGALGLPLNSGGVSGSYYYPSAPFMFMDADGKAVVAWNDARQTPAGYTGQNVYVRHLDSLLKPNYQPPLLRTQLTQSTSSSAPGSRYAESGVQSLIGTSNAWTLFQVAVSGAATNIATPLAAIRDDYNLGTVSVSTYEFFNQTVRTNNGHPYLDRNYTISVTNHPPGASIQVRLYFTKAEFDSLKAHDASIHDPGDLAVIKQPSTGVAPPAYTATANDLGVQQSAWGTIENVVAGVTEISGYYIEVAITDFSNFFIMSAGTVLPVTMQSFTVESLNKTALLKWSTASELNNDHFDIQRSADGTQFTTIGRVQGHGTTSIPQDYRFTDAVPLTGNNYYRIAQSDIDGRITYSQIRLLSFTGLNGKLTVYPNPVRSALHIQLPQAASGQDLLQLFDLNGLKVLAQSVPAGSLQADADLRTLAPGVYILHYGNQSARVIKQ